MNVAKNVKREGIAQNKMSDISYLLPFCIYTICDCKTYFHVEKTRSFRFVLKANTLLLNQFYLKIVKLFYRSFRSTHWLNTVYIRTDILTEKYDRPNELIQRSLCGFCISEEIKNGQLMLGYAKY